ncbi:hypothetical protein WA158_001029 [Blastocystis sp. Blastoise]
MKGDTDELYNNYLQILENQSFHEPMIDREQFEWMYSDASLQLIADKKRYFEKCTKKVVSKYCLVALYSVGIISFLLLITMAFLNIIQPMDYAFYVFLGFSELIPLLTLESGYFIEYSYKVMKVIVCFISGVYQDIVAKHYENVLQLNKEIVMYIIICMDIRDVLISFLIQRKDYIIQRNISYNVSEQVSMDDLIVQMNKVLNYVRIDLKEDKEILLYLNKYNYIDEYYHYIDIHKEIHLPLSPKPYSPTKNNDTNRTTLSSTTDNNAVYTVTENHMIPNTTTSNPSTIYPSLRVNPNLLHINDIETGIIRYSDVHNEDKQNVPIYSSQNISTQNSDTLPSPKEMSPNMTTHSTSPLLSSSNNSNNTNITTTIINNNTTNTNNNNNISDNTTANPIDSHDIHTITICIPNSEETQSDSYFVPTTISLDNKTSCFSSQNADSLFLNL